VTVALALLAGCDGGGGGSTCGPSSGVVERVIDGDTIELATGEKIRYLLVDTPESVNGATDCFGHEAATFNTTLVEGKTVSLAYDEAGCEDRFGRTLAYVTVEGREVNTLLVERGYGCVLYIPPAGESRRDEFEAIEAQARAEQRGVWGACEVVTCD
jgi:micrococcal nuclease